MKFNGSNPGLEEYPAGYYEMLLEYIKNKHENKYWHVLPKEMANFWNTNRLYEI